MHETDENAILICAGHDRIELFTNAMGHRYSRRNLAHLALDFSCCVLALGAMLCDFGELVIGVRTWLARENCFHQPLRDEICKATIGRSRMSLVVRRKTEVLSVACTRDVQRVFTWTDQLHDCE